MRPGRAIQHLALVVLVVLVARVALAVDVSVRVQLLSSDTLTELDSTYQGNTAAVFALFDDANELWAQAGIKWKVESVDVESARFESAFKEQVLDELKPPTILLAPANETVYPDAAPLGNSSRVFQVVFVRDLARWGTGVYNHRAGALMHTEKPSTGDSDVSEGTTLAQGLGLMLSLGQVGCNHRPTNLMAVDCGAGATKVELEDCQMTAAKAIAEGGEPWLREGDGIATCPCDGCGYNYDTVAALGVGATVAVFLVVAVVLLFAFLARRKKRRMQDFEDAEEEEEEDAGFGMGSTRFGSERSFRQPADRDGAAAARAGVGAGAVSERKKDQ